MAATRSSALTSLEEHREAVSKGVRYRERCSRCDATSGFTRHEVRRRLLRLIVDLTVQVHVIVVARWKCARCRHVFTDFPSFILPYRRYASLSLMPLANDYLEQDRLSYQRAVAPGGRVIGYVTAREKQQIDERALHRSTLWRFLLFLGCQSAALESGLNLYSDHDPLSSLHRFLGTVAPRKHRSEKRQEILRTARRLLHLINHWERTFAERFFPRFATRPRVP